jgi:hypothetical protein
MQTKLKNRKKTIIDFLKRRTKLRKEELRFKNEEGTREHLFECTKNDEGQSGTICSTNSG